MREENSFATLSGRPYSRRMERMATARLDGLLPIGGCLGVAQGDVVRVEREGGGGWLYCAVDAVLEDGEVVCSVLEAQCWPDLVRDGVVPGRRYAVAQRCILSIVRRQTS